MDHRLDQLAEALEESLKDLQQNHKQELAVLLAVKKKLKKQSRSSLAKVVKIIGLLEELQFALTSPLYTLVDGMFGEPLCRNLKACFPIGNHLIVGGINIAFIHTKAAHCAVRYKIPDILEAGGPMSVAQICDKTEPKLSEDRLAQLMRVLKSLNLIRSICSMLH